MYIKGSRVYFFGDLDSLSASPSPFLVSRIQRGSYGIDRRSTIYYEDGNSRMVDELFDPPEVRLEIESFDSSARLEFMYAGVDFDSSPIGSYVTFDQLTKKVDILSPMKDTDTPSGGVYYCSYSVAAPGTQLEELSYTFPETGEASMRATAVGGEFYNIPGGVIREVITGISGQTTYQLSSFTSETPPPVKTKVDGVDRYIYYLAVNDVRKYVGVDYSETYDSETNTLSFTLVTPSNAGDEIVVVCAKNAALTIPETIHPNPQNVLPAAIKQGHIEVYFELTPGTFTKIGQIINLELTARTATDTKYELGFAYPYVAKGNPEITATVRFRPWSPADFYRIVRDYVFKETETRTFHSGELGSIIGAKIALRNPYTNEILKTFYLPSARLTIPGFEAAPDAEAEPELNLSVPGGEFRIYKGDMP